MVNDNLKYTSEDILVVRRLLSSALNEFLTNLNIRTDSIEAKRFEKVIDEMKQIKENHDLNYISGSLYTTLLGIYHEYLLQEKSASNLLILILIVDTFDMFEDELLSLIKASHSSSSNIGKYTVIRPSTREYNRLSYLTHFFKLISPTLREKIDITIINALETSILLYNEKNSMELLVYYPHVLRDIELLISERGSETLKSLYLKEKLKEKGSV